MTQKRHQSKSTIGAIFFIVGLSSLLPSALADTNFLKQGIAEFNAGNYSDASGHLGAALSTDFNNSVLHYYLGNCYVHMKQRESAIREFRIAYALDPDKDVGKYAKQALAGLSADGSASPTAATPNANADSAAKAAVDKLLDLKSKPGGWMPTGAGGTAAGLPVPTGLPPIGSTPGADPNKPLSPLQPGQKVEIGRGGRLFEPTPTPTPPTPTTSTANDTARQQLEALRKLYEGNRYVPTTRTNQEIQKTADNLRELMTQQTKPGGHHLVPAGTNLYIRNYQTAPPKAQPPLPTPANTPKK
ncbi:hypothetical protein BH10CYA1_BH10CYA1_19730 [soil metagenome]